MWPFDLWRRDRRRERGVVTIPGGWRTERPAGWHGGGGGRLPIVGHTGDPWGSLSTDWSTVSPHAAENLAAVLAAVNAISTTIAGLPAYVVKADDFSREEVKSHPLMRLIRDGCNGSESWSDLLESALASALLSGNALARVSTDSRGHLAALHTIPWSGVTASLGTDDELVFDVTRTQGRNAGKRERLLRDECLFVKDRSDDGHIGTSRLSRAGGAMKIALSLQASTSTFITNAARPSGVLVAERTIPEPVATRLKADWNEAYRGGELGKVALLSGGVTWTNLGLMSAEDAQLVSHREFSVQDVSRVFSVPLFMLGDSGRATYASARESSRQFAMQALQPWVSKLQRAFQQSVLGPEYRLVIDLSDLLRADPEARWASWQRARAAGVLSPNDIRAEEDWPASTDPSADSIAPPNTSAAAAGNDKLTGDPPPPSGDTDNKIIDLGRRHAGD